eukprot:403369862
MSVITEEQLKRSVSQAIKQVLVDSKYTDEPISFGQAVVTHHFLTQLAKDQQQINHGQSVQNKHQLSSNQNSTSLPVHPSQHISNLNQSIHTQMGELQNKQNHPSHVVQFDLLQQQEPEFKTNFGRKKLKFEEEARSRSPSKWKTEQRDNFRYFVDSPDKQNNKENNNKDSQFDGRGGVGRDSSNKTGSIQDNLNGPKNNQGLVIDDYFADQHGQVSIENEEGNLAGKSVRINQGNGNELTKQGGKSLKRPQSAQKLKEKNMDKRIGNLNSTTRWLPDSAFTTYFGKPAFHLYGKGNTNPAVGGNIYGQYMLTHNVNPESGEHLPQFQQTYDTAIKKGMTLTHGLRVPTLPRKVREDIRLTPNQVEEINNRLPIMPKERGNKGLKRANSIKIAKPDLAKSRYFNSKHTTPDISIDQTNKQISHPQKISGSAIPQQQIVVDVNQGQGYLKTGNQVLLVEDRQNILNNNQDLILNEEQDIGDADYNENHFVLNQVPQTIQQQPQQLVNNQTQNQQTSQQVQYQSQVPLCQLPTQNKAPQTELNPRNYQYLPSCWTQRIRPAGKLTYQSESLYDVVGQKQPSIATHNFMQETI